MHFECRIVLFWCRNGALAGTMIVLVLGASRTRLRRVYYYGEGFFNPSPINRDFKIHIRRKSVFSESLGVAEGGI